MGNWSWGDTEYPFSPKYRYFISLKAGQNLQIFIGPVPPACHVTLKHAFSVPLNWPAFRLLLFWLDTAARQVSIC